MPQNVTCKVYGLPPLRTPLYWYYRNCEDLGLPPKLRFVNDYRDATLYAYLSIRAQEKRS